MVTSPRAGMCFKSARGNAERTLQGGGGDGNNAEVAGIHALDKTTNNATFASCVPAFEYQCGTNSFLERGAEAGTTKTVFFELFTVMLFDQGLVHVQAA